MATGYILKPTGRRNPRRGVTVVNPRRSVLPRATGRERSSVTSWGPASNARKRRRNGNSMTGRVVEAGRSPKSRKKQSSTQSMSGRLVPNKKAGSYARKGKGASRNTRKTVKSGTKRKRLQSRNSARKTKQVAKKTTRTGRFVKVPAKKVRGKVVRKAYSYRKPKRNKTTKRKMTRNAIPRWEVSVHPGTGKRGIKGTKMSLADRKKWTKRGVLRSGIGRFVRAGKRVQTGVRGKVAAGHWRKGVVHPVTGRTVGGQKMSERDRKLFKSDGTTRKGVGPATVRAAYGKGTPRKPKKVARKATPAKRKPAVKKKTAAKRKTRGKRYRVRKPSGGTYLRRYPKRRKKAAKRKPAARRGKYTVVKVPAKRSRSGKIIRKAYSYKRKATAKRKPAKKRTYKRRTARRYRVRKPSGGTYLRRYPTKRRKPAKRKAAKRTYKRRTAKRKTARRYRVRKPSGGTYMRRYPRRKAKGRKRAYYRKRANGRRKGKIVRRKAYTRADGTRVKATSYRLKKTGTRRGRITRNPYKRSKVKRKGYTYSRTKPRRKRVRVPAGKRSQWYPHHYGGRWVSQKKAGKLGLLTQREKRAMMRNGGSAAMVTNPEMLAMLPTSEQLMSVGKAAGLGFVGFGAAVATGRALTNVTAISQYTGNWTSVLGNIAAGLGFWAVASYLDDERLNAMKPFVAAGAGLAAIVNTMLNLVGSQIVPSRYAAWIMPGAGSVAAAPQAAVEPVPELEAEGTGFGQIDIYEAALDGVGGIEEELEMELDRLSGDGIFDSGAKAGIFSGLDGTGTPVEEAYAGMGAQVEEAYAGMNEYLEVPMSGMNEYLEVPMSEYLEVPMSEYLEVPMSGMGAQVEEAYAGMGQSPAAVEASIRNRPLMPGFKAAVQKMVQERVASGRPMDNAFYQKLGQAAASLARKKFDQRVQQVAGRPGHLPMEPWKAPLLRTSAPMYKRPVGAPAMAPGTAEPIPTRGPGNQGIFADEDNDGIF